MCEHEYIKAKAIAKNFHTESQLFVTEKRFTRKLCKHCGKTPTEIDLEQQLAAARDEIARLTREISELRRGDGLKC